MLNNGRQLYNSVTAVVHEFWNKCMFLARSSIFLFLIIQQQLDILCWRNISCVPSDVYHYGRGERLLSDSPLFAWCWCFFIHFPCSL